MEKVSSPLPSREILEELVRYVMPFGKYKGQLLIKLPEAYLAWFARTSMPRGKLGELIETALVIRHNGLDGHCPCWTSTEESTSYPPQTTSPQLRTSHADEATLRLASDTSCVGPCFSKPDLGCGDVQLRFLSIKGRAPDLL